MPWWLSKENSGLCDNVWVYICQQVKELSCPTGATGNVFTQICRSQIGQRDTAVPGVKSVTVVPIDMWPL